MKTYYSSQKFPAMLKNPVVTLGNFDGVHRAHQKMLQMTRSLAKKKHGKSVVYTFNPHPVKVLAQASAPPMINTLEQKLELIEKTGIDVVVLEPFNLKFAHLEAKKWFEKIIVRNLHAAGVIAGYDFTFGTHRSGTAELLQELCRRHHIDCRILEAQLLNETLISSTQIRHWVAQGDMRHAADLLGRPFFIDGQVIQGMGRGKTLGIRTANLKVKNELLPQSGVYACFARVGKRTYPAVTNIGMNPTFGGQTLSIETHLLNFKKDVYDQELRVFFVEKIREEQTFSSPEELTRQIQSDIKAAQKILRH
jgi:riboflavin kinase/FMN adenylyltransferase